MSQDKLVKFIQSKKHLNDECRKIIKIADKKNFLLRDVAFYVLENYQGIDQFLIHWNLIYTHYKNESPEYIDAMNELYDETLNKWVLEYDTIENKDAFILHANLCILNIPTKISTPWIKTLFINQ